jgi:hypothetical protein
MAKCPVCETQHTENDVEICSVCGYDLTPYPPVLGQIPPEFLEKEKKRILAAKRVWERSQMKLAEAEAIASKFQTQLDGIVEKIDRLTQEQNREQLINFQSQLDEINKKIDRLTREPSQPNFSELLSQQETRIIEAIESPLKSILDEQQKQRNREEISLKSSSGWNYSKLNDFLESGNWKAADEETARMMLAVAGRTSQGYLDTDDIEKFPCEDLRIIDHLWVKYSNGRFGFSVQKQIYINCGGKPDGNFPGDTIWYKFVDEVGWRVNGSYYLSESVEDIFSAPWGHLPRFRLVREDEFELDFGSYSYCSLAQRLVTCSI